MYESFYRLSFKLEERKLYSRLWLVLFHLRISEMTENRKIIEIEVSYIFKLKKYRYKEI